MLSYLKTSSTWTLTFITSQHFTLMKKLQALWCFFEIYIFFISYHLGLNELSSPRNLTDLPEDSVITNQLSHGTYSEIVTHSQKLPKMPKHLDAHLVTGEDKGNYANTDIWEARTNNNKKQNTLQIIHHSSSTFTVTVNVNGCLVFHWNPVVYDRTAGKYSPDTVYTYILDHFLNSFHLN